MKGLYNTIAILFIIVTFGAVSVNIKYSDGSVFKYRGWVDNLIDRDKNKIKDKMFSEYPCSDYLHNALHFISEGKYDVAYDEICHALLRAGDKLTENESYYFAKKWWMGHEE